mmetsp:Transcript_11498/g.70722  ORF Transcript_11498/g.70722 Transcript_11498/m.70722 type:complete len:126 (+) Transcript_11498:738-1115(+)
MESRGRREVQGSNVVEGDAQMATRAGGWTRKLLELAEPWWLATETKRSTLLPSTYRDVRHAERFGGGFWSSKAFVRVHVMKEHRLTRCEDVVRSCLVSSRSATILHVVRGLPSAGSTFHSARDLV